jgi:hypothetical protein
MATKSQDMRAIDSSPYLIGSTFIAMACQEFPPSYGDSFLANDRNGAIPAPNIGRMHHQTVVPGRICGSLLNWRDLSHSERKNAFRVEPFRNILDILDQEEYG